MLVTFGKPASVARWGRKPVSVVADQQVSRGRSRDSTWRHMAIKTRRKMEWYLVENPRYSFGVPSVVPDGRTHPSIHLNR